MLYLDLNRTTQPAPLFHHGQVLQLHYYYRLRTRIGQKRKLHQSFNFPKTTKELQDRLQKFFNQTSKVTCTLKEQASGIGRYEFVLRSTAKFPSHEHQLGIHTYISPDSTQKQPHPSGGFLPIPKQKWMPIPNNHFNFTLRKGPNPREKRTPR